MEVPEESKSKSDMCRGIHGDSGWMEVLIIGVRDQYRSGVWEAEGGGWENYIKFHTRCTTGFWPVKSRRDG